MIRLSNFLFAPSDCDLSKMPLCCKHSAGVLCDGLNGIVYLNPCATASFDCYFNFLSLSFVREELAVSKVALRIRGKGRFTATVMQLRDHGWTEVVSRSELSSPDLKEICLEFKQTDLAWDGLLYLRIEAAQTSELHFAAWEAEPLSNPRNCKIGIVITQYKHQHETAHFLSLLDGWFKQHPEESRFFELIVVDNSSDLIAPENVCVKVIRNRNLGGSGGFARGLLYLDSESGFTHALFMDDDGSAEPESILRLQAIFRLAYHPDLALAGGLLKASLKTIMEERGARITGCWRVPNHENADMANNEAVLETEMKPQLSDYGAWCFFAFPLNRVTRYPVPFFVRGDDCLFGIQNGFRICSVCGIGCWIPPAVEKAGPRSCYLDTRANLICSFYGKSSLSDVLEYVKKNFFRKLYLYSYTSAAAVLAGARDVFENPDLLTGDLDGRHYSAVQKELLETYGDEVMDTRLAEGLMPSDLSDLFQKGLDVPCCVI